MKPTFQIGSTHLTVRELHQILQEWPQLQLAEDAMDRVVHNRNYLDNKVKNSDAPVYGINTGFGALCDVRIGKDDLEQLQENLVLSHACGTGAEVPADVVRLMLVLKVQALAQGYSGVQLQTVQRLLDFFNEDCLPIVFQQGSLGASGDLAPLAHLSLPLLGQGRVRLKGQEMPAAEALKQLGWKPIKLKSKEGLALLNGTQFMSAHGVYILMHAAKLTWLADLIASISLDAYHGLESPFDKRIHLVRPHYGQGVVAERVRKFLSGSNLMKVAKTHVQDPYSFRCVPQVHGATVDTVLHGFNVISTEINSVTDNPTIFDADDDIISAGNFHGQPLALILDFLAIALAELGSISERRTYQLIGGNRNLPPFLVANPGINSGLMIPQYTAAGIVSLNKQLASPSSVDSIESSNGQEDHVSMGANAAVKCLMITENLYQILGIELLNASQALGFRKETSSDFIEDFIAAFRKEVPFIEQDRLLHDDLIAAKDFLRNYDLEASEMFQLF